MTTGASPSSTPLVSPLDWTEHIAAGRTLLVPSPPSTQPSTGAIRRAVSTAYYAMFHALVSSSAEVLVGLPVDAVTRAAWLRIYRMTNHGFARSQLQNNRATFSPDAQIFADIFCHLQDERHNADYNPLSSFTAQTASNWLNSAEAAIIDFLHISSSERAAIGILTTVRIRR